MGAGEAALSAAVRPDQRSRPQASAAFRAGGLLALYTDGLIERRTEDIDTGLARLAESLVRHGSLDPESLADALLDDLTPERGTADDTALVVIRLCPTACPPPRARRRAGSRAVGSGVVADQ